MFINNYKHCTSIIPCKWTSEEAKRIKDFKRLLLNEIIARFKQVCRINVLLRTVK